MVLAHEEANGFKHDYIGTEHILLGLLRDPEGFASHVLGSFDITVERVRGEVVRTVGVGQAAAPARSRSPTGQRRRSNSPSRRPSASATTTSAPSTSCSGWWR